MSLKQNTEVFTDIWHTDSVSKISGAAAMNFVEHMALVSRFHCAIDCEFFLPSTC